MVVRAVEQESSAEMEWPMGIIIKNYYYYLCSEPWGWSGLWG